MSEQPEKIDLPAEGGQPTRAEQLLQALRSFVGMAKRTDSWLKTGPKQAWIGFGVVVLVMVLVENLAWMAAHDDATMHAAGVVFFLASIYAGFLVSRSWKIWWRLAALYALAQLYSQPTPHGVAGSLKALVLLVLVLVALAIVFVVWMLWSDRPSGTTIQRGAASHVNADGSAKKGYASQAEAQAQAERLHEKDGATMSVYQCGSCPKWHVGHAK